MRQELKKHGQLILGNQLFAVPFLQNQEGRVSHVFMREDRELCTYFQFHPIKIFFFLQSMRNVAKEYQDAGIDVHYEMLQDTQKNNQTYEEALELWIQKHSFEVISVFEIEDSFFEKRIISTLNRLSQKLGFELRILASPMFLFSRSKFSAQIRSMKKPFMKVFYERVRKETGILMQQDAPVGGQFSFDVENRKKLPKGIKVPDVSFEKPRYDADFKEWIADEFQEHPGSLKQFPYAVDRKGAQNLLKDFLKKRFQWFGEYEDALSPDHDFLFHSVLSPYLNNGLLTPNEVLDSALKIGKDQKTPLNSVEGFVRQILGWREFIRGMYQNYEEPLVSGNFFNHQNHFSPAWDLAQTGIPPLDDVLKKVNRLAYAHHIERLMVLGNLMNLCGIKPDEAYRFFMERFLDSSDWVMVPNVYGMALYSDGGIFTTKPYLSGSNYLLKMGPYSKGDWCLEVDGLYWGFIEKHQKFFSSQPRLSMMVKTFEKMSAEKKEALFQAKKQVLKRLVRS